MEVRGRGISLVFILLVAGSVSGADRAQASGKSGRPLSTGFADKLYASVTDDQAAEWAFQSTLDARAEVVRVNVLWADIARSEPVDAANASSASYDFDRIDAAVMRASAHGRDVLLTIYDAPSWAEGSDRPSEHAAPQGTWKPDPAAFGQFAKAIALRYSGTFVAADGNELPRVEFFQAWNEPNLAHYLTPQYDGSKEISPQHYRAMLNSFYAAVKSVNAEAQVVTAGTAPYGESAGGDRMRPLAFQRTVLCLSGIGSRKLERRSCPERADFDVFAHHPISTYGSPDKSAFSEDDVATPDLAHVRKVLRFAEKEGTTGTRESHPLWATELWWESDPPDPVEGLPLAKHARYIQRALYLVWKGGAEVAINLQIRDEPFEPNRPYLETATGVYFADGNPKPALTAFRFPLVTSRTSHAKLEAWGKAPVAGNLVVERRGKTGWKRVVGVRVDAGEVFAETVRDRDGGKFRARIGEESSLVWNQKS
jgi:hypothetical protein